MPYAVLVLKTSAYHALKNAISCFNNVTETRPRSYNIKKNSQDHTCIRNLVSEKFNHVFVINLTLVA